MRDIPDAVRALERDLRAVLGDRLQSLVVYTRAHGANGGATPTMAVVKDLSTDDLSACAVRLDGWHESGLATPLVMAAHEFGRSLDAFPFEFGAILADHAVVAGASPFEGLSVEPADLRRATETQARSHLLHLREGYLETRGRGDAVADLIVRSSAALAALVRSAARLHNVASDDSHAATRHVETSAGIPPGSLGNVVKLAAGGSLSIDEARRIFPPYLEALEKLANAIDSWGGV
jgi:hypothetical protein